MDNQLAVAAKASSTGMQCWVDGDKNSIRQWC